MSHHYYHYTPSSPESSGRAAAKKEKEQQKQKQRQLVQLSFYARDLKKKQTLFGGSNINPFLVVIKLAKTPQDDHKVLGRTETIENCANPVWTKSFDLEYQFGETTYLNVGIYDAGAKGKQSRTTTTTAAVASSSGTTNETTTTSSTRSTTRDKPLGSCMFEVGAILGCRNKVKAKKIRNNGGVLFARLEVLHSFNNIQCMKGIVANPTAVATAVPLEEQHVLRLHLKGTHLKNVESFREGGMIPTFLGGGISDPFLELFKQYHGPNGSEWRLLYRSEVIDNNLNPTWKPFNIRLSRLFSSEQRGLNRNNNISNTTLTTIATTTTTSTNYDEEEEQLDQTSLLIKRIKETSLKIHILDHNHNGKHKSMGMLLTTVQRLLDAGAYQKGASTSAPTNNEFVLHSCIGTSTETATANKLKKNVGSLQVLEADIIGSATRSTGSSNDTSKETHSSPDRAHSFEDKDQDPSGLNSCLSNLSILSPTSPSLSPDGPTTANNNRYIRPKNMSDLSSPPPIPPPPLSPPPEVESTMTTGEGGGGGGRPLFLDYIAGGCELQMCFAIDFTGSNGDPRVPGTLHHIHRNPPPVEGGASLLRQYNEYEKAILSFGSVIVNFQKSGHTKIPVWGFGAKPSKHAPVNHCFHIGEANGMTDILDVYRSVFNSPIFMSGPTHIGEVIQRASEHAELAQREAKSRAGRQIYTILMIVTDGSVDNIEATCQSLWDASSSPLSVIIVGVGNTDDFTKMKRLQQQCHENIPLGSSGVREILQFVEFRHFHNDLSALAANTLEDIPVQLVDYFYNRGIMPGSSAESDIETHQDDQRTSPAQQILEHTGSTASSTDEETGSYSAAEEYDEYVDVDLTIEFGSNDDDDINNEDITVVPDDKSYHHIDYMFHTNTVSSNNHGRSQVATAMSPPSTPTQPRPQQQDQQRGVVQSTPLTQQQQQHQYYHQPMPAVSSSLHHSPHYRTTAPMISSPVLGSQHNRHLSFPLDQSPRHPVGQAGPRSPVIPSVTNLKPNGITGSSSWQETSSHMYSNSLAATCDRNFHHRGLSHPPFTGTTSPSSFHNPRGGNYNSDAVSPSYNNDSFSSEPPFYYNDIHQPGPPSSPSPSQKSVSSCGSSPASARAQQTIPLNTSNKSTAATTSYQFRVKVPDCCVPGSAVQVPDPRTGQLFVVEVPQGARAGSTFLVTSTSSNTSLYYGQSS